MKLTSMDLIDGGALDLRHGKMFDNVPPQLGWTGAPPETSSYLLALVDIHPEARGYVHWVVDQIAAEVGEIELGGPVIGRELVPYAGPFPPSGTHEYVFTLYALDDSAPVLPATATLDDARAELDGHVLGTATLTGSFTTPEH
jgi:Raf kinase inhibitor-like YbhB/YbcL family protein